MSAERWAELMWTACWQGALAVLLVWLLCRIGKLSARVQSVLWTLACLKLLVSIVGLSPVRVELWPPAVERDLSVLSPFAPESVLTAGPASSSVPTASWSWLTLLFALYVAGVIFTVGRVLLAGMQARQLVRRAPDSGDSEVGGHVRRLAVRMGLSAAPRVVVSSEIDGPMVVGHLKPTLMLPADFESLSQDEQEMALAHELAHLRRKDLFAAVIPVLAHCLFFFFPPTWLACREWATTCEAACDEEALRATGALPSAYGNLLLKMAAKGHRPAPVAAFGATSAFHSLKRRIGLVKERRSSRRGPLFAIPAVLLAALSVVPWSLSAASPKVAAGPLANTGAEEGRYKPAAWSQGAVIPNVEYIWDNSVSRTGKRSLCIVKTEQRYFPIARWNQEVPYDGKARQLRFGAWIKAESAYKAVLDAEFYSERGEGRHQWAAYIGAKEFGDPPANHGWKWYSGVVDIPPGTKAVIVSLQCYGPGTVWMDDASVKFISAKR